MVFSYFSVDSNINKIYFTVASAKYTICFLWSAIACVTSWLGRDGRVVGYQRSGLENWAVLNLLPYWRNLMHLKLSTHVYTFLSWFSLSYTGYTVYTSHHNHITFALIAKLQVTLTFLYSTWFESRFLLHSFLLPSLCMLLLCLFRLARESQTVICRHLSEYIFHSCRFLHGIWL